MIREIKKSDLNDDFFTLLAQLSGKVSDYDPEEMWETYNHDVNHFIYVDDRKEGGNPSRIVATSSLLIENKLLHCGSRVGHIEDVCTLKCARGQGIGRGLIEHCIKRAKEEFCYKVILDCSADNIPFYINCGLYVSEYCMRIDL